MAEKKQEMIMMTQEQFTLLVNTLSESNDAAKKSFARCTKRFDGERNFNKVEEFVTSISVYKKIENISDENALEGLTLLLTGTAATWWNGVKSDIKKWNQALDAIRTSFAPKMQPHEIYLECFAKKQTKENIDSFVCEKRALLAVTLQTPSVVELTIDLCWIGDPTRWRCVRDRRIRAPRVQNHNA